MTVSVKPQAEAISRRSFLVAATAAGASFGFVSQAAALAMGPASSGPAFEPTIWFSIDRQGIVTVNVIRAELGQHVGTALARILADELEADWDKVRVRSEERRVGKEC